MTDELYLLTRYTPFWAVPALLIALECTYLSWIRKKKKYIIISSVVATLAFLCVSFYYWSGGPEKSVEEIKSTVRFLSE